MRSLAKKVSRKFDDRVELYVQTGIFLRESDPDIAKSYFDTALSKIDKIEDSSESDFCSRLL
jgi:hypothetical protein